MWWSQSDEEGDGGDQEEERGDGDVEEENSIRSDNDYDYVDDDNGSCRKWEDGRGLQRERRDVRN